jgi:hypothetical protein
MYEEGTKKRGRAHYKSKRQKLWEDMRVESFHPETHVIWK